MNDTSLDVRFGYLLQTRTKGYYINVKQQYAPDESTRCNARTHEPIFHRANAAEISKSKGDLCTCASPKLRSFSPERMASSARPTLLFLEREVSSA